MIAKIISNCRIEMLVSMLREMRMSQDEVAKLLSAVEAIQEEIVEDAIEESACRFERSTHA